ncbi:hypothetical protein Tco_0449482 [Tanacetum coccineum]
MSVTISPPICQSKKSVVDVKIGNRRCKCFPLVVRRVIGSWCESGGTELIGEHALNVVNEKRSLASKALDLVPSYEGEYGEKGEDVSLGGDGVDWDDSSMVDGVFVGAFGRLGD